jgi:hypothetical protein
MGPTPPNNSLPTGGVQSISAEVMTMNMSIRICFWMSSSETRLPVLSRDRRPLPNTGCPLSFCLIWCLSDSSYWIK